MSIEKSVSVLIQILPTVRLQNMYQSVNVIKRTLTFFGHFMPFDFQTSLYLVGRIYQKTGWILIG